MRAFACAVIVPLSVTLPTTSDEATIGVLIHADSPGAGRDTAIMLLRQLAQDSRKDAGNVAFEIAQQPTNLNHCEQP